MLTPVIQKNKEAVWVASKEVGLEIYAEKAKLTLLSREPAAEQNSNIKVAEKCLRMWQGPDFGENY
jgi:hypothetical protein